MTSAARSRPCGRGSRWRRLSCARRGARARRDQRNDRSRCRALRARRRRSSSHPGSAPPAARELLTHFDEQLLHRGARGEPRAELGLAMQVGGTGDDRRGGGDVELGLVDGMGGRLGRAPAPAPRRASRDRAAGWRRSWRCWRALQPPALRAHSTGTRRGRITHAPRALVERRRELRAAHFQRSNVEDPHLLAHGRVHDVVFTALPPRGEDHHVRAGAVGRNEPGVVSFDRDRRPDVAMRARARDGHPARFEHVEPAPRRFSRRGGALSSSARAATAAAFFACDPRFDQGGSAIARGLYGSERAVGIGCKRARVERRWRRYRLSFLTCSSSSYAGVSVLLAPHPYRCTGLPRDA